ncbi:alpha/beta fold hydrolase [Ferrimonas lipolytica]|uniref:Alpha/beta fold hydrolase n=1 Tax=Ferrimonas lipolytica TaxID=2724191 RepID=A0A6H1UCU0_9GAMM|nr:alpha/beta fold hydrolase [Ferrimonas lipolytica]QIZ75622.1 alpha/beta fold hydrolase [Ferrimonas lipolytica]
MQEPKSITLTCADGVTLAASYFAPQQPTIAGVILAPATGIKRQFYFHFCCYLASKGIGVLSFDNRGIGESLVGDVSKSRATIVQWGQLDMTAALKELQRLLPEAPHHLIGHSAGGQLVGLMDNCHQLKSVFAFASSSGSLRNMQLPFIVTAHYFMNLFIPLNNLLFGHTKSQWVGMGEPLPKGVAQQWRRFCNGRGYIKMAFGNEVKHHHFDSLKLPIQYVHASDDDIANSANVAEMLRVFPLSNASTVTLVPAEHGLKTIGHMQFFSRQAAALWPLASDWITKHSNDASNHQTSAA